MEAARIYRGHDGFRAFWNTFFETFHRVTVSPHEFIESGEHVLVPNRAHFWGRDGVKVVEERLYQDRAGALEAVGLSE